MQEVYYVQLSGLLFGISFSWITILYFGLVALSIWATIALIRRIDMRFVHERLSGAVPVNTSGWVLLLFGLAFSFRAIGILFQAGTDQIPMSEVGVLVADLAISILWMVGGILLLLRRSLGYISGLGLLITGSELFIALILFLLLQPVLTGSPFALVDVIVVSVMGLVCFIPTGLFVRGILSKG